MPKQLLVIDTKPTETRQLCNYFQTEGYVALQADDIKGAKNILKTNVVSIVILDIALSDGSGIEFIKEIKRYSEDIQILVYTKNNVVANAVLAMKYGAFDYILKGDELANHSHKIKQLIKTAIEKFQNRARFADLTKLAGFDSIIGTTEAIDRLRFLGAKVARTNTTVLLLGETGVGKDVMAEAIHSCSSRAKHPFVAINCSAIGKNMLESELFGYKAGAFTGALKDKKGLFEEAENGTIFLDEIGDMDLVLQSKILRVLENRTFIKMGDTKTVKVNCRIIAATHVNLLEAVEKAVFRKDLYYRISSFVIQIPPLRERLADLPLLVSHFTTKISHILQIPIPKMEDLFMERLLQHNWRFTYP
ncbi:MAG: sigma-54-dependent Fis family transcriptional regulator [Flavobacteriales bacterium]|nr:MAG: sigma-54-dependent Fis family transcriptional regulator [Flavobacteriales bacterium]